MLLLRNFIAALDSWSWHPFDREFQTPTRMEVHPSVARGDAAIQAA